MPVAVDPTWEDITAAIQSPGDYEVDARGVGDIAALGMMTLKAGVTLRVLDGALRWTRDVAGSPTNIIKITGDNVGLSGALKLDGNVKGIWAPNVSGVDVDISVTGNAMEYFDAFKSGAPVPKPCGYAAWFEGVQRSKLRVRAVGTRKGAYVVGTAVQPALDLDVYTHLTDVMQGNNQFAAYRSRLITRVSCRENFGVINQILENGDGIQIPYAEDVTINAEIMHAPCYSVSINPNANASGGRNIHFDRLITRGGVTAALNVNNVEGLTVGELDVLGTETSMNLAGCPDAHISHMRLSETGPVRLTGSSLTAPDAEASGITYGGQPSPWIIQDADSRLISNLAP